MNPSNKMAEGVIVLDSEGKFLEPTHPANARRLLESGQAKIKTKKPFTIVLNKIISTPDVQRRTTMGKVNIFEYFREPKAVYIQNISSPIGVLSLEFKTDHEILTYRVPANRNPVILSDFIPFDAIKNSGNFLKFLQSYSSHPARLQLLTEEEFLAFYQDMREVLGASSVEEVIEEVQIKAGEFNTAVASKMPTENMNVNAEVKGAVMAEVNPRVMSLCQQLDPANPSNVGPKEALDILGGLDITAMDCDYVLSHTYDHVKKENSLIRRWALQRQQEMLKRDDEEVAKLGGGSKIPKRRIKKEAVATA